MGAITEGFGDDKDEPEDKIRRGIFYTFTQATDSIPLINGMITGFAEKAITGKTKYKGNSNVFVAAEKFIDGSKALTDADIKKAAQKYWEASALTLGLPTSGVKEAFYTAEQLFNGEMPSALWGRR